MRVPASHYLAGILILLFGFSLLFYGAVRYETTVCIAYQAESAMRRILLDNESTGHLAKDERLRMAICVSKEMSSLDGNFFWTFEALFLCSIGLIVVSSGALFIHFDVSRHLSFATFGDSSIWQRHCIFVIVSHAAVLALFIIVGYFLGTLRGAAFATLHAPLFIDLGLFIAYWAYTHCVVFFSLFLAAYFFLIRALQSHRLWLFWIWRDGIFYFFLFLVLYCFCGQALFVFHIIRSWH